MSLHFLLKAEARTLSVVQVMAMGDGDAFTLFRHVRWGNGETVVCPHCGMPHRHYFSGDLDQGGDILSRQTSEHLRQRFEQRPAAGQFSCNCWSA